MALRADHQSACLLNSPRLLSVLSVRNLSRLPTSAGDVVAMTERLWRLDSRRMQQRRAECRLAIAGRGIFDLRCATMGPEVVILQQLAYCVGEASRAVAD